MHGIAPALLDPVLYKIPSTGPERLVEILGESVATLMKYAWHPPSIGSPQIPSPRITCLSLPAMRCLNYTKASRIMYLTILAWTLFNKDPQ